MRYAITILLLLLCGTALSAASAYTVTSGATTYTGITGTALALTDDSLSAAIAPSGFSVSYFGTTYTSFKVGSNGYIIMGSAGTITDRTPTTGLGKNPGLTIAPAWYDLHPASNILWSFASGVLTVEYKGVDATTPTSPTLVTITCKIVINCATGVIEFHYGSGNLKTTAASTVSIAGATGATTQPVINGSDGANVSTTGVINAWPVGRFIRFTPAGAPVNQAPAIAVTSNSTPVTGGQTLNVSHNSTLAALNLSINVSDPNSGDTVSLAATITNVGTTGMLTSEFSSAAAAAPYSVTPATGTFNAASTTHLVTLTATDNGTLNVQFTFSVAVGAQANVAPTIAVSYTSGSVSNGGTINVNYGVSLASLSLQINVNDADGNNCSLAAAITNLGGTGIVLSEFQSASAAVPFARNPSSGTFNTVAGTTHAITLTANDGTANTVFTFNIVQAAQPAAPSISVLEGSITGIVITNGAAATAGRIFGNQDVNLGATAALTIVIANNGSAALTLGTPSISGASGEFVLSTSGFNNTVAASQNTSFTIAFDPASAGVKNGTVSFTHNDATTTTPFSFDITGTGIQAGPLTITTTSLGDGIVGNLYGPIALSASGGYPGYTWAIISGNLPAGLTLNGDQISGTISGAPGAYAFTVQVTDTQSNTQTQNLSIQVLPAGMTGGNGVGAGGGGGCSAGQASLGMFLLLGLLAVASIRRRKA